MSIQNDNEYDALVISGQLCGCVVVLLLSDIPQSYFFSFIIFLFSCHFIYNAAIRSTYLGTYLATLRRTKMNEYSGWVYNLVLGFNTKAGMGWG